MKYIKSFFSLTTVAMIALFFVAAPANLQAQQIREHILLIKIHVEPQAAAYLKFVGVDGESQVNEGQNVVGENTRTGEKLVVVIRDGKLAKMGTQDAAGKFKDFPASSSICLPSLSCSTVQPPKCFRLPGGGCICVCGPWLANP